MKHVQLGLDKLKQAIKIRGDISSVYRRYHSLTKSIETFSSNKIKHYDVKRAVDAIHYFGGGWPHPSSKGRMEGALDAIAGMFKVLALIGEGDMVKNHLAKRGIQIKLLKSGEFKNTPMADDFAEFLQKKYGFTERPTDLASLVRQVVDECDDLQGIICKKADIIRDELRPDIKEHLEIDDPEYDRLTDVMKLGLGTEKTRTRIPVKINKVKGSIAGFNAASTLIKETK